MLFLQADLNITEMFQFTLTNALPVDMTIIGLLVLLGFGLIAWKAKVSATAFYPLMFVFFYGVWLGTGGIFPFSALMLLSFAIIGGMFVAAVFRLANLKI
jgi:hypothetical protein